MTTNTDVQVARAEVVGSLLRPAYLREARQGLRQRRVSAAELRAAEDRAVQEAIALQEAIGLDVITDGEMRREGWNAPLRAALSGFTAFPGGTGYRWRLGDPEHSQVREDQGRSWPFVTERVRMQRDVAPTEYAFLKAQAHCRTKYCLPAPSYYRTHWHEARSRAAYTTVEAFLTEMRDYTHQVVRDVMALGCDYVQLDAPNYGRACDPEFRALMEAQGRRGAVADLRFDAVLDSSVFDGLTGATRAMHICRGNSAGAWNAQGGYEAIAAELFPHLDLDVLLLEYDTRRGSIRAAGAAGREPAVRLCLGRDRESHHPRRAGGQAAPGRPNRPPRVGLNLGQPCDWAPCPGVCAALSPRSCSSSSPWASTAASPMQRSPAGGAQRVFRGCRHRCSSGGVASQPLR
jgi:5-methyltetrahydropteroyltriglutamate--homocysteine methyltransferase